MSTAMVARDVAAPQRTARPVPRARSSRRAAPYALRHLQAAGNRAVQRTLRGRRADPPPGSRRTPGVRVALVEDAGAHALARAAAARRSCTPGRVLARDDNRRATPPPAPAPAPTPATGPSSGPGPSPATNTCGPDVTQQVIDVLALLSARYISWSRDKRLKQCNALESRECAGSDWDVVELHNRGWLDTYAPCAAKAGPCKDTVHIDGTCSYGGSVNYVVFGAMCKLCDIPKWLMEDMIWAYKGDVPFKHKASPNYGPSMDWARAGYDVWPAAPTPAGDRPGCNASCPTAYHDAPFQIHWYPELETEVVPSVCKAWSSLYDHPEDQPPLPFGP